MELITHIYAQCCSACFHMLIFLVIVLCDLIHINNAKKHAI